MAPFDPNDSDSLHELMDGTSILITGGTGSFGKRFVETVLREFSPQRLAIFSRDELKQFDMQVGGLDQNTHPSLRYFIGDIRDQDRLTMATRGVDVIIHAAALKQVATAEYNQFE